MLSTRRQSVAVDIALTAMVLAATLPRDAQRLGLTFAVVAVDVALALPLLWRRRWPTPVFAVIAVVCAVQWLIDLRVAGSLALLVGLYAVAAYDTRRRAWVAAAVVEVGIVLAVGRWAPEGGQYVALMLLNGSAAAPFVAGMAARTRSAYLAALEERADRLERERDQQGRIAAAAERARIASELHDVVAHHVSVMVTLADGAVLTAPRDTGTATAAMTQVATTGRLALTEMRRLLGVLHEDRPGTDRAPQPGLDELAQLVDGVRATGLPVTLVRSVPPVVLPVGAGLVVYRVVQEALTNTLKHARGVTGARVELCFGPAGLDVTVSDDGQPLVSAGGAGFGVAGMAERAAVYAGTVLAGPGPQGGWQVRLHLDLPVDGEPQ